MSFTSKYIFESVGITPLDSFSFVSVIFRKCVYCLPTILRCVSLSVWWRGGPSVCLVARGSLYRTSAIPESTVRGPQYKGPLDMFKLVQLGPSMSCLIDRCWYLRGDLRRDSHGNSKGQVHRRPGEGETSLQGLLPRSEDHRARTG